MSANTLLQENDSYHLISKIYQKESSWDCLDNYSFQKENKQQSGQISLQQLEIVKKNEKLKLAPKKKKIRKEMVLFQDMKGTKDLICKYDYINKFSVNYNLITPKIFFLAGGIVVELANQIKIDDDDHFKCAKAIQSVNKFTDGSIIVNIMHTEAQHDFERVIKILQTTQNLEDYNLSLQLKLLKQPVLLLKETIERVQQVYQPYYLANIIQGRKILIEQIQKKFTQQILKDDDFGQSVSYVIDWNLKSMGHQHFCITTPTIALLGTNPEDFVSFIMRKSLFWLITPQGRRQILDQTVKFLANSQRKSCSFIFPDIQLRMIDDITINCKCEIHLIMIEYPPELCFQGQGMGLLNNSDCTSVIKFNVTQQHLEQIIKIRQEKMQKILDKNIMSWINQDDYIIDNFEYYMQSQIFLEKFYQNNLNNKKNEQTEDLSNRCNFKIINQ